MEKKHFSKEEILEQGKRLLELVKMDIIKEYREVLHNVVNYQEIEPKREFYKFSKLYKYYIEYPYERLEYYRGEYIFREIGYNIIGKGTGRYENRELDCCLSLHDKEKIIKHIEECIKKDEEEYNALFE